MMSLAGLSGAEGGADSSAQNARKKEFKRTVTQEDGRRKRTENAIQIRKNKRAEGLRKRRAMARKAPAPGTPANANSLAALADTAVAGMPTEVDIKHLSAYQAACMSEDAEAQYNGTKQVRRLLSRETDPPVEAIIQSGLLPRFVQFLGRNEMPKLQFEAAWALTNVASTQYTSVVVDLGVTPFLSQLLRSPNSDVREQSLWCLGNIAGDRTEYRDMILRTPGALANLLLNITHPENTSMLRNATWALSNLTRGKPQPDLDLVRDAIPVAAQLLNNSDTEVLTDTCWTLSYVSDGDNSRIQAVMDAGAVPSLVRLLGHTDHAVATPALRSVGNVVSGSDEQTNRVCEAGALPALVNLLSSSRRGLRKEACWALSNVAAGTALQVQGLMATPNAVQALVNNLTHGEWSVKKEATWAVCNLATSGTPAQIHQLVQNNVIAALCTTLDKADAKVVAVALDALGCILRVGQQEGISTFSDKVEEDGGLDLIEALQDHEHDDIYNKASSLIRTYFDADEEDGAIEPDVVNDSEMGGATFAFGAATPIGGDVFSAQPSQQGGAPAEFSFMVPS